ncbi:MAG: PqqD family protein [Ignavibacteriota bacterium]
MVWSGVAERWSLDRVAESISKEFAVPVQTAQEDAAEFLRQLVAEGLLLADAN